MSAPSRRSTAITAAIAAAVVLGMTGLSFAAVPLYDIFCKVTGYGGATQTASAGFMPVIERTIEVRFDSNIATDLPIEFTPMQASETLHLGETGIARYRVRNLSDQPVTAIASYNVTPHKVGIYFEKLECFCFQSRTLAPGESAELPVVYRVNPELAIDPDTEEVAAVTLSYTYFRTADAAAADLERAR